MQVLEQNVKWKAAVMQTTLHSAGLAVLPHKKAIMKIIAALFAAPSKVKSLCCQFPSSIWCLYCLDVWESSGISMAVHFYHDS